MPKAPPQGRRVLKLFALALFASIAIARPGQAQSISAADNTVPSPEISSVSAQSVQNSTTRTGFTILTNVGFGVQRDQGYEESATGLAGINLGIGGFLNNQLAVMFRISGTNAKYDFAPVDFRQVSGVAGGSIQYWTSDRVNIEAGIGLGFWRDEFYDDDQGFGIILAVNGVLARSGGHNLIAGVDYSPAFTGSGTVHNFGFTVGYQFHRR